MAQQKVQSLIDSNPIIVFSKSYCPYCIATKDLLKSLGANFKALELDHEADGSVIQDTLFKLSGQKTVPNIYIKGEHIGGNSDLQALHKNGGLVPKISSL